MTVEQMEIEYIAYVCFLEGNPTLAQVAKRSKEVTDRIWGVKPVRNKRKTIKIKASCS